MIIQNVSNRTIFRFPALTFTFIILIRFGTVLVLVLLMKVNVLIISEDESIIQAIKSAEPDMELLINIYNKTSDPIEIVFYVMEKKPAVVVLDDDYLKPYSLKILKSIKKFDANLATIFLTSDTRIQLGREISPIGVYYYGIKPMTETELSDLIKSVSNKKLISN